MRATRTTITILTATVVGMTWFAWNARADNDVHICKGGEIWLYGRCFTNVEIDASPLVFCIKPNTMLVGGKCIDITMGEGGVTFSAAPMSKCPQDYALLTYPGTWTLICARDLQAPK